jgi:TFIIF-interacting CTD phosphatase-like protein
LEGGGDLDISHPIPKIGENVKIRVNLEILYSRISPLFSLHCVFLFPFYKRKENLKKIDKNYKKEGID